MAFLNSGKKYKFSKYSKCVILKSDKEINNSKLFFVIIKHSFKLFPDFFTICLNVLTINFRENVGSMF